MPMQSSREKKKKKRLSTFKTEYEV